jgi:ADP-ribose pyrophosphatase YjhB (NUDIX family)
MTQEDRPTRDFVVTVFPVHQGRVAFLYDELSGVLSPPSGHIRPEELPGQAALRVVLAQTGLPVELLSTDSPDWSPAYLPRPEGLMLERITATHEHICLVYFARPAAGFRPRLSQDLPHLRWFEEPSLATLGLSPQVAGWAAAAISRSAGPRRES